MSKLEKISQKKLWLEKVREIKYKGKSQNKQANFIRPHALYKRQQADEGVADKGSAAQRQTQLAQKVDGDIKLIGVTKQGVLNINICKQKIKDWRVVEDEVKSVKRQPWLEERRNAKCLHQETAGIRRHGYKPE